MKARRRLCRSCGVLLDPVLKDDRHPLCHNDLAGGQGDELRALRIIAAVFPTARRVGGTS